MLAAIAAGTLAVLTAGILIGYAIASTQAPAAGPGAVPVESVPLGSPQDPRAEVKDTFGTSDPAVTAWHDNLVGPISAVFVMLSDQTPRDTAGVRKLCQSMTLAIADLQVAPKAPRADVEGPFRAWVNALTRAAKACPDPGASDAQVAASSAGDAFAGTVSEFDVFGQALDLYYDFAAAAVPSRELPPAGS
jgi:hypothetical protein